MNPVDDASFAEAGAALAAFGFDHAELLPLTGGLINDSWRVLAADGRRAVLQRLHPVFAPEVNLNLERVTAVLAARGLTTPRLLRTVDGAAWVTIAGRHWRALSFIDGTSTASIDSPARAAEAGHLLARFHTALAGYTEALPYLRPPVHEPLRHFARLATVLGQHQAHRLGREVKSLAGALDAAWRTLPALPLAPLRLVHGDPKISNLLFDEDGRGCCLVDLDTLAHAPLAFELGDAFRSWCNPGPEDAPDASFSAPLFEAALAGYAREGRGFMTPAERAAVVPATAAIYLELAARFATDALEEHYFSWAAGRYPARGEHNLARARNQLAAAHDLLAQRKTLASAAARLLD